MASFRPGLASASGVSRLSAGGSATPATTGPLDFGSLLANVNDGARTSGQAIGDASSEDADPTPAGTDDGSTGDQVHAAPDDIAGLAQAVLMAGQVQATPPPAPALPTPPISTVAPPAPAIAESNPAAGRTTRTTDASASADDAPSACAIPAGDPAASRGTRTTDASASADDAPPVEPTPSAPEGPETPATAADAVALATSGGASPAGTGAAALPAEGLPGQPRLPATAKLGTSAPGTAMAQGVAGPAKAASSTPRDGSTSGRGSEPGRVKPAAVADTDTASSALAEIGAPSVAATDPTIAAQAAGVAGTASQQVAAALSSLAAAMTAPGGDAQDARDPSAPRGTGPRGADGSESSNAAPGGSIRATADGGREIIVKLDPEHLGSVAVRLRLTGQSVDIAITVSNPSTLVTLDRDRHMLTAALSATGLSGDALMLSSGRADATPMQGMSADAGGRDASGRPSDGSATALNDPSGGGGRRRDGGAASSSGRHPSDSRETVEQRSGGLYV